MRLPIVPARSPYAAACGTAGGVVLALIGGDVACWFVTPGLPRPEYAAQCRRAVEKMAGKIPGSALIRARRNVTAL